MGSRDTAANETAEHIGAHLALATLTTFLGTRGEQDCPKPANTQSDTFGSRWNGRMGRAGAVDGCFYGRT